MPKRAAIKVTAGMVVLLVLTISTAGARQLWNESQAQSSFDSARTAANHELARALNLGVAPKSLAPYRSRVNQLAQASAPPSSLWSSSRTSFYNHQAGDYRAVSRAIRAKVTDETRLARVETQTQLLKYKGVIATANSLGLSTSSANSSLNAQTAALRSSSSPREYRSVAATLAASFKPLNAQVSTKEQYVQSLLQSASNRQYAVVATASQEISAAQSQLSLFGLLSSRAASYLSTFNADLQEVRQAPTAAAAALKESRLHDDIAAFSADYIKTLPSKMIVVSTENQSAVMYQAGREVNSTPVTTGGPELPTDHGVFHIYEKITPFTFHSPWPPSSPYYYPPTPIQYWMPFDGGEGLHDASWRSNFGPGSNLAPTNLGTGNSILGTHGCVNLPLAAAAFTWDWAPLGTTVIVV